MVTRGLTWTLVAVVAVAPLGCSFGYSSESSWKTLTSPSRSSGSSSGEESEKKEEAYRDDVRDYTYAYVTRSAPDAEGFERGIGQIAHRHGISNWEEDGDTWRGIGAGLAKADAAPATVDRFARDVARSNPARTTAMRQSYDAARAS